MAKTNIWNWIFLFINIIIKMIKAAMQKFSELEKKNENEKIRGGCKLFYDFNKLFNFIKIFAQLEKSCLKASRP